MPVEHLGGHLAVEVGDTDRGLIKDESSLLVGNVLGSGRVRSQGCAALAAHEAVHTSGERLKSTADAGLSRDEGHGLAFEVPLGVLQTHSVDLLVRLRLVGHREVVGVVVL